MTEAEVAAALHRSQERYKAHVETIKAGPAPVIKGLTADERYAFEKAVAFKLRKGGFTPARRYGILDY